MALRIGLGGKQEALGQVVEDETVNINQDQFKLKLFGVVNVREMSKLQTYSRISAGSNLVRAKNYSPDSLAKIRLAQDSFPALFFEGWARNGPQKTLNLWGQLIPVIKYLPSNTCEGYKVNKSPDIPSKIRNVVGLYF